jgi:hypothetical protein
MASRPGNRLQPQKNEKKKKKKKKERKKGIFNICQTLREQT